METPTSYTANHVGPVLVSGPVADAVIAAIKQLNDDVVLFDHGSYVRVLVPWRCRVTREAVEQHLGRSFQMPGDLEGIMSAFKGTFNVSVDEGSWAFDSRGSSGTGSGCAQGG